MLQILNLKHMRTINLGGITGCAVKYYNDDGELEETGSGAAVLVIETACSQTPIIRYG